MSKERGPFPKWVEYVGKDKRKWKCNFCGLMSCGNTRRIRAHLAGISGLGIKVCEEVTDPVRAEALKTFEGQGRGFNKSTEGTSGKGMEGTVFGASQSVLPSEGASNPNGTQNLNPPGCVPQQPSFYPPTGAGTPQDQGSLPRGDMPVDNLDNTQQCGLLNPRLDAAHGNEIASSLQQLPMGLSASSCPDFSERQALHELRTLLESETEQQNARGLSSFPNDEVCGNSMSNIGEYLSLDEHNVDGFTPDSLLDSISWSDLYESREAIVNTSEEIQTNELHNPTVGSSLQNDSSLDVDGANRLQDCGQPFMDEVVPVRSNTSPTDAVQHPGQLPPRCDKEDGNDIRQFPSRTPMDIDPSTALQHSSDSHIFEATTVDSLVPEASTNPIGPSLSHDSVSPQRQIVPHRSINLETVHQNPTVPSSSWENHLVTGHPQALMDMDPCMPSSSQAPSNAPPPPQILPWGTGLIGRSSLPELDMNEGAPMTSHPNTGNDFEESGALKRKLAVITKELVFAASVSLKKLRTEVVNLLANVEKLPASEDCLLPRQQADTLMYEVEDLIRQDKGLFEVRETKFNKLIEREMVGEAFQINTTKILEFLVGNQISQLGIYGMGGVGKTTIMVHIHNRLLEEANYGNVLWITVSQDFNTQRLQDDLWKVLGMGILHENDVKKRAAMLCGILKERGKSTIILDDVWECFDLNEVGIPVGANGIKLVLTTRSFEVCRKMECKEVIKIEPLSHIEAESLFLKELGSEETLNLEIKEIVKSIVNECAGLPLALITMARSMRGVTYVHEWKDSLRKLRDSDVEQMDMEEAVLKKLQLSYDRLRKHEVQQCFLSCALYPEDKLIAKFELIEFFIDQGLFGQLETREEQYFRGHTILNKLANVCLLEDHGREMKMHDLIRDMALRIMSATSIVKAGKGLKRMLYEEYWTDTLEKVSLMENNIEEIPLNMSPNCPKLSTFLLNKNSSYDLVIPDSFFKQLWGLKVLNLSGSKLRELPDSISDLVNLRALLLGCCWELCHIPYLGKLTSLRKLDMYGCAEVDAIKGLEMLVELRYLDIGLTRIKRVPKGTLGALRKLQYLRVQAVNEEDIIELCALEALKCKFEDVDDFNRLVRVVNKQSNNLRYYRLHMCQKQGSLYVDLNENPFGNFERSVHIEMETTSFAIVSAGRKSSGSGSGSGICILFPQNVQTLSVRNCDGATNLSDVGLPENLEELTIDEWKNLRVLSGREDEEIINTHDSPTPTPAPLLFPRLGVLSIHTCDGVTNLSDMGVFENLEKLEIFEWKNLRVLNGRQDEMINIHDSPTPTPAPLFFQSLRVLVIYKCLRLRYLFGHGPKVYLPHLRKITIDICEEMMGITAMVTPPSTHLPPAFPSLKYIRVKRCHKLKRVVDSEWLPHFCNLRTIVVVYCKNMEEIIGGPPPYMPVEEISLEKLFILACVNLRKLFSRELLIHLPKLRRINVKWCDGMVEMISGAGQGQEGSIMTSINNTPSSFQSSISLPKLNYLRLCNLPQLKSICEVPITCDSMEFLEVCECPELNRISLQLRIRDFEDPSYIRLQSEEKSKPLIWVHPNAQVILQSHPESSYAGTSKIESILDGLEGEDEWSE